MVRVARSVPYFILFVCAQWPPYFFVYSVIFVVFSSFTTTFVWRPFKNRVHLLQSFSTRMKIIIDACITVFWMKAKEKFKDTWLTAAFRWKWNLKTLPARKGVETSLIRISLRFNSFTARNPCEVIEDRVNYVLLFPSQWYCKVMFTRLLSILRLSINMWQMSGTLNCISQVNGDIRLNIYFEYTYFDVSLFLICYIRRCQLREIVRFDVYVDC